MSDLDETDAEILGHLAEDGRRPFSHIAEDVGLSAPAVRDRIERLQESGVIRRITVDVDRSTLADGVPVLVDLGLDPADVDAVRESIDSVPGVEHVFVAAEPRIVFQARVPRGDVRSILADHVDLDSVRSVDVTLLTDAHWQPSIEGTEFALECVQCGNTVTAEGESATIDGDRYHFCCPSCLERFESRYEDHREAA